MIGTQKFIMHFYGNVNILQGEMTSPDDVEIIFICKHEQRVSKREGERERV